MTLADPNNPNSTASNAHMSGTTSIYEGQGSREQDTFAKDFMKHMLMTGIMSNPKARQGYGMAKMFRDQGPMGVAKGYGQQAGIEALFNKVGPWGMLLQNKGGPLGLGIMDPKRPMSSKISQLLLDPRVSGRMGFAKAFPGIAGLGWLMNKIQQRIPGQTGALGQGLGPQLANLFGRKSYAEAMEEFGPGIMGGTLGPRIRNFFGGGGDREEGTGIMGGTLGPRIRNLFGGGGDRDESPIQEIEVTAQRREEQPRKPRVSEIADMIKQQDMYGGGIGERLAETGGESQDFLSGLVPGAAQGTNQMLRAANWARSGPHRKLAQKIASGQMPVRKISSGGGRK